MSALLAASCLGSAEAQAWVTPLPPWTPQGLTGEQMHAAIRSTWAVQSCFRREQKSSLTVLVEIAIDPPGSVRHVVVRAESRRLVACLETALARVRFPAATQPTTASVPLAFQRGW